MRLAPVPPTMSSVIAILFISSSVLIFAIFCERNISNFFSYLTENTELCTQMMHDKVMHETFRIHQYATNRTDTAASMSANIWA